VDRPEGRRYSPPKHQIVRTNDDAFLGLIALILVGTRVPETRGRTLEELEGDVRSGRIFAKTD
jgi:hypothetical protein